MDLSTAVAGAITQCGPPVKAAGGPVDLRQVNFSR